jgi:hypothetical protein
MGGLPGNPQTDGRGYYTATVEQGWGGRVTPQKDCYEFNPPYKDYSNITYNKTDQNYTGTKLEYTVSGYVRDSEGTGISGVVMSGLPDNPETNISGYYIVKVGCGWSGRVTPQKDCYTFSPSYKDYSDVRSDQTDEDYIGRRRLVIISGCVQEPDGTPVTGVEINGTPEPLIVGPDGCYRLEVPCGWIGHLTPQKDCYTFSPPDRDYSGITSDRIGENFTGARQEYTVSGYVRDSEGTGISGVVMEGLPGGHQTNSSGYYSAAVPCDWSGQVCPEKACYSFDPNEISFENVRSDMPGQDYQATEGRITISGYVRTATGDGIAGVHMEGLPDNPTSDAEGRYTAEVVCGWSGLVTPAMDCYEFEPSHIEYNEIRSGAPGDDYTGTKLRYRVSVCVRTYEGTPINGVVLGGFPGEPETSSDGCCACSVDCGWAGTLIPRKECHTFDPPSYPLKDVRSDKNISITGTVVSHTISGFVRTTSGEGISDVVMKGLPNDPRTDASGFYSITVGCGWVGTVAPDKECYAFEPPTRFYGDVTGDLTNQNYTGMEGEVTISGHIRSEDGSPVSDVTLVGGPESTQTDGSGFYSLNVPCGWSGAITPGLDCYSFDPSSRAYSNVTSSLGQQDYTGTAPTFVIAGRVHTAGGAGIAGVAMTGLPGGPLTDEGGFYEVSVRCGWAGTVTPTKDCHTFSPPSRSYPTVFTPLADQNFEGREVDITISGHVRTVGGIGIPDVVMEGLPGAPRTDADGFYEVLVGCGWSGSVIPVKEDQVFDPPSRQYTNASSPMVDQDYIDVATSPATDDAVAIPNPCHMGRGDCVQIVNVPIDDAVTVKIYDMAGSLVKTLRSGDTATRALGNGMSIVTWDGYMDGGRKASYGVYFFVVEGNGHRQRGRFALIR